MTPDLRALLRRVASVPAFCPVRPSEVRALAVLAAAGYVRKVDVGRWCATNAGKAVIESKVKE